MQPRITNSALANLQSQIIVKKNYVMALQKRLELSRENFALKTDHEKNEVDIVMYETLAKIGVANKHIRQLEFDFQNLFEEFKYDLEDLSKNYTNLMDVSVKHQAFNDNIKHLLYHANWKHINENIDEKILFFKSLKEAW